MTDGQERPTAGPFDLLGSETRLGIVAAFVEHRREQPGDPALAPETLRDRVGIRDRGQLSYHLDALEGHFVCGTDDGYRLTAAGRAVAGAIISGAHETDAEKGPVDLDETCGHCGAPVTAEYADGVLAAECSRGHELQREYFPPAVVDRVPLRKAMELSALRDHHELEYLLRNVCPNCHGSASAVIERDGGDGPKFAADCDDCGFSLTGSPGLAILTHPALRDFYLERDRDVRAAYRWTLPFLVDEDRWAVTDEDPLRVRIDVAGDDGMAFVVDEYCTVREYHRTS